MRPDLHTDPPPEREPSVHVPRHVEREIKDLVHPIVLRRTLLWRAGLAAAVLVAVAVVAWAAFFRPPSGEALLAEAVEAAGGMAPWNAIEEGTFTRVHTVYDERGAVVRRIPETYYFRKGEGGHRLAIETRAERGLARIGRDDRGYWATLDDEPADPEELAREEGMMCESDECTPTCSMELAFYRFSMPFKLTDPGVVPTYGGSTTVGGRPAMLLNVGFEEGVGGDAWTLYVDDETKLVRRIDYYANAATADETPPQEIYWSDHRAEDGLTFSHRQTYYRSNGTRLEDYVITHADFSSPVPDAVFDRPAEDVAVVQTAAE